MIMTEAKTVDIAGVQRDPELRARVAAQMVEVLERVGLTPQSAHVSFLNDAGPKRGRAIRCALAVRLPYRPPLHTEATGSTRRVAFDGAFAALERRLERYRERDRDSRRRPKKYYAAKRVVEVPARPRRRSTA